MSLHRMRDWSDRECASIGRELADTIAAHSDDLMYGGKHCAETFNALADALAVGARAPGGVFFRGLHWCIGSGHYGIEAEQPCRAEVEREAS
jgi:hypothetical protein